VATGTDLFHPHDWKHGWFRKTFSGPVNDNSTA